MNFKWATIVVIILCMQQHRWLPPIYFHSVRFQIYICYMVYCYYEADKPVQVLCTCDRVCVYVCMCVHTQTSLILFNSFCWLLYSTLISLCQWDRLIGFDFVNFIIIFLIASHSFPTNLIIRTPKVRAKRSNATQSKTKQNVFPPKWRI